VLRQEFGELDAARQVLSRLVEVIDDLDVDEEMAPPKKERKRS
jgi:hypothetical protein